MEAAKVRTAERRAAQPKSFRKIAIENGDLTYKSERPCPAGHMSFRRTSNGQCVECEAIKAREWLEKDPANLTKRKEYVKRNAERYRVHARNRKAKLKGLSGSHTQKDIIRLIVQQRGRCAYCQEELDAFHVDHIVPLSKGGDNGPRNLQITCPTCNLKKSRKDPLEYARQIGKLL